MEKLENEYIAKESLWSTASAIGSQDWVKRMAGSLNKGVVERLPDTKLTNMIGESEVTYSLHLSSRDHRDFWTRRCD